MKRNNRAMKIIVNVTILSLMLALTGCSYHQLSPAKAPPSFRTIHATAKIISPEKIISAPLFIAFPTKKSVRIDALDAFGVTQVVILLDSRRLELYSMADRCYAVKKSWLSKLGHISGRAFNYQNIIEWLFPESWPEKPVTYRLFSYKKQYLDISHFPPTFDGNGRVVISYPVKNVEISIKWNEDRLSSSMQSSMTLPGEWLKCMNFPFSDAILKVE